MNCKTILQRVKYSTDASKLTKNRDKNKILMLCNVMGQHFSLDQPEQIRLKHLQYIKNHWLIHQGFSQSTNDRYIRTMRLIIDALGRKQHWSKPLGLEKDVSKGGRPTVSRVTHTRSVYYSRNQRRASCR